MNEIKRIEMNLFDGDVDKFLGWEEDEYWRSVSLRIQSGIRFDTRNMKGKKFLEVGCGRSVYIQIAKDNGMETVGFDISKNFLKLNQNTGKICGDTENLPFQSDSIDYLLCVGVIHHVPNKVKMISEIRRVIKRRGSFAIVEPHAMSLNWIYWAIRKFLIKVLGWEKVMKLIGFGTPHESFVWKRTLSKNLKNDFYLQFLYWSPLRLPPIKWIKDHVSGDWINKFLERVPIVKWFGTYIIVLGVKRGSYNQ